MTAIPVALASDKRVEQMRALTQQCVDAWCRRWGVDVEAAVAAWAWDACSGECSAGDGWVASDRGATAAVRCPPELGRRIAEAVFAGGVEAGSLASDAGDHLSHDLLCALFQSWGSQPSYRPIDTPPVMSRWHAPVRVDVRLAGAATLQALVSAVHCAVSPHAGSKSRQSLPRADMRLFDALPARASLRVGAAEISVLEAAGLQVGDVIVLDSLIHGPLELRLSSNTVAVPVFLGRAGATRAALMAPVSKS